MNPKEEDKLHQFLTTFEVTALGQGDPIVGINLLATMACVLADLAPDDGTVVTLDGTHARLGTSLLVTGAASAGRMIDEVITEVCLRQKNLAAQIRAHLEWIKESEGKQGMTAPPTGPGPSGAAHLFAETQMDENSIACRTPQEIWPQVLAEAPAEQFLNLASRPKLLVSVARPGDLEAQLKGLRPGRPLVHLGLSRPADLAAFSELGAALLEGRYTAGTGCETIRANLIITDPLTVLREAAKAPDERTAWLAHFLVLCDGGAGPDVPDDIARGNPGSPETVTAAFREALGTVMTLRMNLVRKDRMAITRCAAAQYRWTRFLREIEPRLPGISGAARNLLPTLLFGLSLISMNRPSPVLSTREVEAFARLLVRRMANARTTILYSGELARRRSQIERVVRKLGNGGCDARTIYKDLSLSAADCDGCLRWLEEAGFACRSDKEWRLVEGARLSFNDARLPLLEV